MSQRNDNRHQQQGRQDQQSQNTKPADKLNEDVTEQKQPEVNVTGENAKPADDAAVNESAPAVADQGITIQMPVPESEGRLNLAAEIQVTQPVVQDTQSQSQEPVQQPVAAKKQESKPVVNSRPGGKAREASPLQLPPAGEPTSMAFTSMMTKEKSEGTQYARALIGFLEQYVQEMRPRKPTAPSTIKRYQEGLYDNLVTVIERAPGEQFKRLWNIAIAFFKEHSQGAFSSRYFSRGSEVWTRDPRQFLTLVDLCNLLEASKDMSTVNQVASAPITAKNFSEDGRGRLIGFYQK